MLHYCQVEFLEKRRSSFQIHHPSEMSSLGDVPVSCLSVTQCFDSILTPLTHQGQNTQNGWHFPDEILKVFSFGKPSAFGLQCHWSSVLMVRLTMSQHWFRHLPGRGETTGHYSNQWEAYLLMYKLYRHHQASTCSFLWPKSTNISISQEGSIYLIIFAHKSDMIKMLSDCNSIHGHYRQVSKISHTKSRHLKDSCTVLRLSFPNPLKPDVKSRMKI